MHKIIDAMPFIGSVLLTIIIVAYIVSLVRRHGRKIGQSLAGSYFRSSCCGSTTTPFGWTQDGWVSTCDECHQWQYLGDDHDNPPPGFDISGYPTKLVKLGVVDNVSPAIQRARDHFAELEAALIGTPDRSRSPSPDPAPGAASSPSPSDAAPSDWREDVLDEHNDGWAKIRSAFEPESDDGEPLALPPQPNIGGEGHPEYKGGHYNSVHELETRFVPYDMLHDPIPGAAVHAVGNVACVGPMAVEPKRGKGDDDVSDRGNADES